MLLVLELDVADLAATRFSISPLYETIRAVHLLSDPSPPAVNRPWVQWARAGQGAGLRGGADTAVRHAGGAGAGQPYHAGLLADGGARSLFGDLHPGLRWSAGKLFLTDAENDPDPEITLGPDGLVLMPGVFIWPEWSVKRNTSTQTTLMYPARGAATVWEGGLEVPRACGGNLAAVETLLYQTSPLGLALLGAGLAGPSALGLGS